MQEHHRLHFLSDRASLIGEWEEETIDQQEDCLPAIIKELKAKLLAGELDAQRQHSITIQHGWFHLRGRHPGQPWLCEYSGLSQSQFRHATKKTHSPCPTFPGKNQNTVVKSIISGAIKDRLASRYIQRKTPSTRQPTTMITRN
nr:type IV toxin-antitoxin system YeeU family antitoxin [Aeromonas sp. BC14]